MPPKNLTLHILGRVPIHIILKLPVIISDILTPTSIIHRYNTRFASKFNHFRVRISTISGKSSFKFAGFKIWESTLMIVELNLCAKDFFFEHERMPRMLTY